jgi:hypothetical protein
MIFYFEIPLKHKSQYPNSDLDPYPYKYLRIRIQEGEKPTDPYDPDTEHR